MATRGEFGGRKVAILRAVVDEYIRTGEPVGSETIAERYGLGVSAATIRNEMATLEDLGYLTHPHTSAGRIPTDLGYRLFVDSLPGRARLRESQRRAIAGFFEQAVLDLEEVLRGATRLLSRLTQYAALAVRPSLAEERLARIELVSIGAVLLVLVVGRHGRVEKRVLDRPDEMDDRGLDDLAGRVTRSFGGLTLGEAIARARRLAEGSEPPERELLTALADALTDLGRGVASEHVLVGGVANLAGEVTIWRQETVRRLVEALERESEVLGLLRDVEPTEGLSVTIGAEHPTTGRWDASVVLAPYRAGTVSLGTIGVVGPTRMDYLTAILAVRDVARRVSELATALGSDRP